MLEYTPLPAYFEQFKLLLLVLLVLLVCAPCICCGCGLAAVTAPCWLFVLLITSPIWIAALACGAATLVLVLVGLVIFKDALPPAQRAAVDEWQFWAQATLLKWNLRAVLYGTGLGPLAEVGLTYLDRVDLEAWRRTIREWDVEGMQLRIVELVEKGAAVVGVKPADLGLTAPKRAIYSETFGGWTDTSGRELAGARLLVLLQRALSRCGLRGVGSTLGFMVSESHSNHVAIM